MPGRRNLRDRVSSFFELPRDVVMNLPRVTLIGDLEIVVENHRGLAGYDMDQVILNVVYGQLIIAGADLSIVSVSPDQVTIRGKIRALRYSD